MTFFLWYDGEVHQNSLAENDGGQWLLAYAFESFEKFRDFAKDYYEQDFTESLLRKLYEEGELSEKELEELIPTKAMPESESLEGQRRCYILIYRFLFWDIAYKVSRLWK